MKRPTDKKLIIIINNREKKVVEEKKNKRSNIMESRKPPFFPLTFPICKPTQTQFYFSQDCSISDSIPPI